MEIFMNFSSGTTICAANRERFLTDPEAVLRELKCSHMMATPSMAALLRPERIGDAFELWTMGEKLSDSVINAFCRPEKGYVLCNAYVSLNESFDHKILIMYAFRDQLRQLST